MEPPSGAGPRPAQPRRGADAPSGAAAGGGYGAAGRGAAGSKRAANVSPGGASESQPLLPGSKSTAELARQDRLSTVSHQVIFVCVALLWVAIGVVVLMAHEGFTLLQALYLTVQTITTVGYGDVSLSSTMEGFMSVYLLGCVVLVAFVLSIALDPVTQVSTEMLRSSMRAAERRMGMAGNDDATLSFGHLNDLVASTLIFAFFLFVGWIFYATFEGCTCGTYWNRIDGCIDGADKCAATGGKILTTGSALYMSIVTLTTVGFGNYSINSTGGVIFSLFWIPAGVAACANFVRACFGFFRWASYRRSYLLQERISKELFEEMDVNRDGMLSRGEFLRYLLLQYELVDRKVLDDISRQYDLLDPGGTNTVSFEAIQAMYAENGVPGTAEALSPSQKSFYDSFMGP